MSVYSYPNVTSVGVEKLQGEIGAAGLTGAGVYALGTTVYVQFPADLSSADQTTLDGIVGAHEAVSLAEYQELKQVEVNNACGDLFLRAAGAMPGETFHSITLKIVGHIFKGLETKDIINDRDNPTVPAYPPSYDDDGAGSKKHILVEAEASRRGLSVSDTADIINPLASGERTLISMIDPVRIDYNDQISAATSKTSIDTIMVAFYTEYAALEVALGV